MNVNFTARQTEITPEIKQYCEKRLKSLKKHLGPAIEVDLILSAEKFRHKVEINIKAKKTRLTVVEETREILNSLNLAFDNLEKKVKKEKEKLREQKRRNFRKKMPFSALPEPGEIERKVLKSDAYSSKPMPLEEAILQFDLKKKEVFVFRNSDSEKWAVIYRRKDGNYGLVEPE